MQNKEAEFLTTGKSENIIRIIIPDSRKGDLVVKHFETFALRKMLKLKELKEGTNSDGKTAVM